ncbi:hypothetical protein NEHOM01_0338 [Nematocida homosporus]|uniref:uncharacterized protein n=1 Tax=Nematocida homosporus TaxID=1912981 RepID=UPI00221FC965|nr:uncharacterized protein NEHOM01_0338 [Nematocida homosporus]KAI5184736.1 hypothetical protein NEHOM01_0338 [Nematocida homosporus]
MKMYRVCMLATSAFAEANESIKLVLGRPGLILKGKEQAREIAIDQIEEIEYDEEVCELSISEISSGELVVLRMQLLYKVSGCDTECGSSNDCDDKDSENLNSSDNCENGDSDCDDGLDVLEQFKTDVTGWVEDWAGEEWSMDKVRRMGSLGCNLERVGEWVVRMNGLQEVEKLYRAGAVAAAQNMLKELGHIESSRLIEALAVKEELLQEVLGLSQDAEMGLSAQTDRAETEMSRKLHWIKEHFYKDVIGMARTPVIDRMIVECQAKLISWLEAGQPMVLTKEEIRKSLVQLLHCNPQGFLDMCMALRPLDLLRQTEGLGGSEEIHLLSILSANLSDEACKYFSADEKRVLAVFRRFNSCIENQEWENLFYLHKVVCLLLLSEDNKLALVVTEALPVLFEKEGRAEMHSIGKWNYYGTEHRLSLFHLKVLQQTIESMSKHLKLYLLTSGALLSIEQAFRERIGPDKIVLGKIIKEILESKDRVLRKYLREIHFPEKVQKGISEIDIKEVTALNGVAASIENIIHRDFSR